MRTIGISLSSFLAVWMVLFAPLATAFHHHAVVIPPSREEVMAPPGGEAQTSSLYPSCDLCLRLILTAESLSLSQEMTLSSSHDIDIPDKQLPRLSHRYSLPGNRAPPLTTG